jgi:hypothetical protein
MPQNSKPKAVRCDVRQHRNQGRRVRHRVELARMLLPRAEPFDQVAKRATKPPRMLCSVLADPP